MNIDRRLFIRAMLTIGAVLALPKVLFAARPDNAFQANDYDEVIESLFGESPVDSNRVELKIPEIAENGAVVPVTASTDLEKVESISFVVLKNPTPLAAMFEFGPRSVATVSVRIKIGESTPVLAVVKADGKLYSTMKDVKVTIGGCGG